ncbi:TonB-dependent siderophore receptor [Oceanispirochaeta sp. M1]|uniref:TonB-dependent receptor plug domain-containing protein n=1 Tax=Oceanispirochaeta sp. M1 TaxID=2283433 RepID=UPI000E09CE4E|nr:TonB-dependent receptor [Oceanispirochaeta sp. M1]
MILNGRLKNIFIILILIHTHTTALFSEDIIVIEEEKTETDNEAGQKTSIERELWERRGARTVAEAINLSPGVTITRSGTTLEPAAVSIRGSNGKQVLILVNGIPQNNGKGDPVNLNSYSLTNIEKIEVIRGGNSAVYGEGAMAGVINIVTKDEPAYVPEAELFLSAGAFQTWRGGGRVFGPLSRSGSLRGSLAAEGRYTGGEYDYPGSEGDLVRTNSKGWAANGRSGLEWNPGGSEEHLLSLDGSLYFSERGVPGIMEFLTPEAELEESRKDASVSYRLTAYPGFLSHLKLNTSFSFLNQESHYENPAASVDEEHENIGISGSSELSGLIEKGNWKFTPVLGIKLTGDKLESSSLRSSNGTSLPGTASQNSMSLFSRIESSYKNWSVTPALRWDFSESEYVGWEKQDDNKGTWSVTTSYSPGTSDIIKFKGNTGTSYHNPGFDDLFWSSGSFASGNPDLLPEESFNWDLGVYFGPAAGFTVSSVFYQNFSTNLIQWLPSPGGTWRPVNIGKAKIQGLENMLSWLIPIKKGSLGFTELRGSYTWMQAVEDMDGSVHQGNQLPYRPMHTADLSLSYSLKQTSLTLSSRYMGYRFTNMANIKYLDDVLTFDTVFKTGLKNGLYFNAGILNITDIQYTDKLGYPVPGREWTIGGGYKY